MTSFGRKTKSSLYYTHREKIQNKASASSMYMWILVKLFWEMGSNIPAFLFSTSCSGCFKDDDNDFYKVKIILLLSDTSGMLITAIYDANL